MLSLHYVLQHSTVQIHGTRVDSVITLMVQIVLKHLCLEVFSKILPNSDDDDGVLQPDLPPSYLGFSTVGSFCRQPVQQGFPIAKTSDLHKCTTEFLERILQRSIIKTATVDTAQPLYIILYLKYREYFILNLYKPHKWIIYKCMIPQAEITTELGNKKLFTNACPHTQVFVFSISCWIQLNMP